MASLNFLPCGTAVRGNSGLENCRLTPKSIQYIISLPSGVTLSPSVLSTLGVGNTNVGIKAILQAEDPNARGQVWGQFMVNADNSEDEVDYSYEDGSTEFVKGEVYKWRFRHRNGFCYHKQLRKQNGDEANKTYLAVDKNGVIWVGVVDPTTSNISGLLLSRWNARAIKVATESDAAQMLLDIEMTDSEQFNLNANVINAGVGIGQLLQRLTVSDAVASLGGTPASGVYPILLTGGCSAKSIASFDTAGALASVPLWKAINQLGATIPITAVVRAGTGNGAYYALTLDTSSSAYTGATSITFSFATIAGVSAAYKAYEIYDVAGNLNFTTPKV